MEAKNSNTKGTFLLNLGVLLQEEAIAVIEQGPA